MLQEQLGEYVEDVSGDSIRVSVFSGKVKLENLTLRRTALQALGLPLYVETGRIKKLVLNIPWSSLKSEPVICQIDGVYVLATHAKPEDWDPAEAKQRTQEGKLAALEAWEAAQLDPEPQDDSFMERLAQTVMRNLQLRLTNLHIRYEHPTGPDGCYGFGMSFSKLQADSCDRDWQVKFTVVEAVDQPIFKLAALQYLAVYVDPAAARLHEMDHESTIEHMQAMIASAAPSSNTPPHIMPPVHLDVSAEVQRNDRPADNVPRLAVCGRLSPISLAVNPRQYAAMIAVLCDWDRTLRYQQYANYRPARKLATAKERWQFAIAAVRAEVQLRLRSFSYEYLHLRGTQRRRYIAVYKRLQQPSWDPEGKLDLESPEAAALKKEFGEIEALYSAGDLIWWRALARVDMLADAEANKQRQDWEEEQKKKRRSMREWYDFSDGPDTGDKVQLSTSAMPDSADRHQSLRCRLSNCRSFIQQLTTNRQAPKRRPRTAPKWCCSHRITIESWWLPDSWPVAQ